MKKSILTLAVILVASLAAMAAGKAEIQFDKVRHDFGAIKAADGRVSATYHFVNTGTEPLVIIDVTNGGCGCTKPEYPKQPIAPGKGGDIVIRFDPSGRRGEFNREVKVKTNAAKKRQNLIFTGVIMP